MKKFFTLSLFVSVVPMLANALPHTQAELANFIAQQDRVEISAGRKAVSHGASKQVVAYGQRVLANHSVSLVVVESLAREQRIVLRDTGEWSKELAHLDRLEGPDFDKSFVSLMISVHHLALEAIDDSVDTRNTPVGAFSVVIRDRVASGLRAALDLRNL